MYLEKNPSRNDVEIAIRNQKRIMNAHSVRFVELRRPTIEEMKELIKRLVKGTDGSPMEIFRRLAEENGVSEMENVSRYHMGAPPEICLYIEAPRVTIFGRSINSREYARVVDHASFCGCEGCQSSIDAYKKG